MASKLNRIFDIIFERSIWIRSNWLVIGKVTMLWYCNQIELTFRKSKLPLSCNKYAHIYLRATIIVSNLFVRKMHKRTRPISYQSVQRWAEGQTNWHDIEVKLETQCKNALLARQTSGTRKRTSSYCTVLIWAYTISLHIPVMCEHRYMEPTL